MTADRMPDTPARLSAALADPVPWTLEVLEAGAVTPNFHRVVVTAAGLGALSCLPGQDLMLRVPRDSDSTTSRRYTIRKFDPARPAVTLDASLHGTGPGTAWIRGARAGDLLDAVGPRGKITFREEADWHLFVADDTGMPGALAMIESLPAGATAIACLEVDSPDDEQRPDSRAIDGPSLHWVHRLGRSLPGDPGPLLDALAGCRLPAGQGHAYVAAENQVVRKVADTLVERGLASDQISAKAYWRKDMPNADHGEPARDR